MANPYEVLGISSNASDSEVKQARRKLLFDLHSDRLPKDLPAGAAELIRKRVIEINNAYEQIQNERQRESNTKKYSETNSQKDSRKSNAGTKDSSKIEIDRAQNKTKANNKQATRNGSKAPGGWIGQVLGALIGVSLVHMCRDARNTQTITQSYADKVEEITTSSYDYCPELKTSIETGSDQGDDMSLKMLSEMRRTAPEGSTYATEIRDLIAKLKDGQNGEADTTKEQVRAVFTKYLPLVCNGDLYAANNKIEGTTEGTEQENVQGKTMEIFANAMCSAMRNNEDMSSVDSRRAVGATYMGKEMDKLPEGEREQVRLEIAQNTENKEWMKKSIILFVRRCPDVAYRMMEN